MKNKIIIGDVHGKIDQYYKILQKHPNHTSIQLGDFGFQKEHDWHKKNIDSNKHKILFGNHDYYPYLNENHSLKDSSYNDDIFTVRGADSIDKYRRTEGLDWFNNEQIEYSNFYNIIDNYNSVKPEIVITHDCPESICYSLFGIYDKTVTRKALDVMFENHKPKIWLFGHHHTSIDKTILGTRFICLNELETFIL